VYQVAWSSDSRLLVSASKDSTIKLFDVDQVCVCVCVCVCVFACVCACLCVCLCVCVYTHTHKHTHMTTMQLFDVEQGSKSFGKLLETMHVSSSSDDMHVSSSSYDTLNRAAKASGSC